MCKKQLIVKTNQLNQAYQDLSLIELRLIQLANVAIRESSENSGFSLENPISISVESFAKNFNYSSKNHVYRDLQVAESLLFAREFSFYDESGNMVKSRWLSHVLYKKGSSEIRLVFTEAVRLGITRIDGVTQSFTKYYLDQTRKFKKPFSIRLYELLIQWKNAKLIPSFDIKELRAQLGIEVGKYESTADFNRYVITPCIAEINQHSDIDVILEKASQGKKVKALQFKIKNKEIKNAKKSLTTAQINKYARLLSKDSEVCQLAYIGEEVEDFIKRIAKLLGTEQGLNDLEEALKRNGFGK